MASRRQLAEVEWEIMEAVWHSGRAVSVRDVHRHLYPNGEKAYTTVQTIMGILADKGFLSKEKLGMVNFFTAELTRDAAAGTETKSIVQRIFRGSFGALANYLVDSNELSDEDLARLKQLIAEREQSKDRSSC